MPGWLKVLLSVIAVIVFLIVVAIVTGVIYVSKNKDAWKAKGREIAAQGRDFGNTTDNQGCIDESVARYKKEPGILSALATQSFMQGCLETSRPTPGFCDKIFVGNGTRMREWQEAQCRHYDLANDWRCSPQLFMSEVMFCAEKRRQGTNSNITRIRSEFVPEIDILVLNYRDCR